MRCWANVGRRGTLASLFALLFFFRAGIYAYKLLLQVSTVIYSLLGMMHDASSVTDRGQTAQGLC